MFMTVERCKERGFGHQKLPFYEVNISYSSAEAGRTADLSLLKIWRVTTAPMKTNDIIRTAVGLTFNRSAPGVKNIPIPFPVLPSAAPLRCFNYTDNITHRFACYVPLAVSRKNFRMDDGKVALIACVSIR